MAETIGAIAGSILGSAAQAKYNMDAQEDVQDFQRKMFRERYQMTVKDMEKAGLNPMLAVSQGAGSVPSGTGGSSIAAPDIQGAISSAQQVKRTESEVMTQKAQQQLMLMEGAKNVAQADVLSQEARNLRDMNAKIKSEGQSASAKAYQDTQDAARRGLVGPKSWYTDMMESLSRLGAGTYRMFGHVNGTPKRDAEVRPFPAVPSVKPGPRGWGKGTK